MKSLSNRLLAIAAGVLADASLAYPNDRLGFTKDLVRLTRLVETRGLGVFTLDLPLLDGYLLDGLEYGRLTSKNASMRSKKCRVPKMFSGLYLRVFDNFGCLRDDADVNSIAFLRQLYCLGKKVELKCSDKRELKALQEYINVETSIREPNLDWASDSLSHNGCSNVLHLRDCLDDDIPLLSEDGENRDNINRLLDGCQRICDILSREIGSYYPDAVLDGNTDNGSQLGLKHGPGAVAEYIPGGNKYDFQNWPTKLARLYPFDSYGRMPLDEKDKCPTSQEVPSRLLLVPKTAKGPRIIAAEPSANMYCQMLLKDFLDKRIDKTVLSLFINLRDQSLSGDMVKRASLDRKQATIDLSSASDRLSLWLLERVFRKNDTLLEAINASRTRVTTLPSKYFGNKSIELKKFASQGTAITFPVQTVVFLAIALSCSLQRNEPELLLHGKDSDVLKLIRSKRNQVRVYGDDIILPTHGYVKITQLMHTLGLKVNTEKSFFRGHFRESCGSDFFKGYDVTPVKPKRVISDNPASRIAVLDSSNNLFYRGYWRASEQLRNRRDSDSYESFGIKGLHAGTQGYGSFSAQTALERFDWNSIKPKSLEMKTQFSDLVNDLGLTNYRWNSDLSRVECKLGRVISSVRTTPYPNAHDGLLERSLRPPTNPDKLVLNQASFGDVGVTSKPTHRNVRGWVALSDLF